MGQFRHGSDTTTWKKNSLQASPSLRDGLIECCAQTSAAEAWIASRHSCDWWEV